MAYAHSHQGESGAILHVPGDPLASVAAIAAAGIIILTGWPYATVAAIKRRLASLHGISNVTVEPEFGNCADQAHDHAGHDHTGHDHTGHDHREHRS